MPGVSKDMARRASRHGLESRDHDNAVLGNEHKDEGKQSDRDMRHPYRSQDLGNPIADPNRHQPFGV
jgi:hypothetical protein